MTTSAFGGNGKIDNNGVITLTVDFRFAPTKAQVDLTKQRLTDFSADLWDASEGQMRIGSVKIGCGTVDEDLADIWLSEQLVASSASNSPLGVIGVHYQHEMGDDGALMFHEFGHYGLKLGDEYSKQFPCGGAGACIEVPQTKENHCIMEDEDLLDNEFCVKQNHDPIRGNNDGCKNKSDFGGAPCVTNCEAWNTITNKYETSDQQRDHGKSCWESLIETFPFLKMPNGLPTVDPPPGFVPPTFEVTCDAAASIVLVLDKSGSMNQPVNAETGEICANKVDDDANGQVDESPCSSSRLEFIHHAAHELIDAAIGSGARFGIVSFDSTAHVVAPMSALDENSAPELEAKTDLITAGGKTSIGAALIKAKEMLDAESGASSSKAVIIVTDGANTIGIPPDQPVPDYVAASIRIFPVATGTASDDPTLAAIANETNGVPFSSPQPSQMMIAANEAWTQWRGETTILGRTKWKVSGTTASAKRSFIVDKGTRRITITIGGEMNDMRGFGVRAQLVDPNGNVLTTDAPPSSMHVTRDRFFVRASIAKPAAGLWHVRLLREPRSRVRQHGSFMVTSTHPAARFVATSDRWNAKLGERFTMDLRPWFNAQLRNAQVVASLRHPDGHVTMLPLRADQFGVYAVTLDDLNTIGTYAMTATFKTTETTRTVPGEAPPAKRIDGRLIRGRAPLPRAVPPSQRSVTRYIVVSR